MFNVNVATVKINSYSSLLSDPDAEQLAKQQERIVPRKLTNSQDPPVVGFMQSAWHH